VKVQIDEKKANPLLERLEVGFTVIHERAATPSRDEIRSALAGALKVEKERVIIDHVDTEFGRQASAGFAKVYDSVESAKRLEKDYLLIRHGLKEHQKGGKK